MARSLVVVAAALCAALSVALLGAGSAGAVVPATTMTSMCAYSYGAGPAYFPLSGQCPPYTTQLAVNDWQQQQTICYIVSTGQIWWTSQSACQSRPAQAFVLVPALVTDEYFCASSRDGTLYYQPNGIPPGGCPAGQFLVVVPAANHPPVANAQAPTLLEDTSKLVTLTGSDQDANQTITFKITQLPAHGKLYKGNSTAPANEITSVPTTIPSAGTSAQVTYKPEADYFGPDSFLFKTNDSFVDSAPATVTLDVQPVNDAPSFHLRLGGVFSFEDAAPFTFGGAVDSMSPGPANEAGQALTFHVSNNNNALFAVQPQISPNGTMTFTYAPDAFGTATVSVYLTDNGGTANGGVDTSTTQTLTITVLSVNDAPSFTLPASPDQTVAVNAGAQTVPGFATNISPGPANEAGQTVAFHVSNSNNALFAVQPQISANGTLTYTPAGQTGTATVSVYLQDNGGTANVGVDTSATKTFTITVAPVVIGQTASPNVNCGVDLFTVQTGVSAGASYTVPGGNWTLTEWSTRANSSGGSMSLLVFRPTATPGSYLVVAASPVMTLTPSVLNTFAANVAVQGGDLLGLWGSAGTGCGFLTGNAGDTDVGANGGVPAVGSTVAASPAPFTFRADISAKLQ
jgi:hypothetical protein